ncbi:MAG: hypothetical protein IJG57_06810 [Firmicutes bacterium]|jgi:hypothetical protein|nr:hypothetical protein [Bacillota bacterium]
MRYDTDQALSEVLRRRTVQIEKKRERRVTRGLSGAAAVLTIALVAVIHGLTGPGVGEIGESFYGAFRLSQSAGGYVLAGVIAFILGAVVTLVCLKSQKRIKGPDPPDRNERGPTE